MSCRKKSSRKAAAEKAAATVATSAKEQRAQALEAAAHYLTAAQEKAGPLAAQAAEKLGPLAEQARDAGARAQSSLQPALGNAKELAQDKVVPALQHAYEGFQKDVLPEIADRAEKVTQHPVTKEATRRGQAAVAALRGNAVEIAHQAKEKGYDIAEAAGVEAPERRRKGRLKKFFGITALIGGLTAAGVMVGRRFLAKADGGWTAHEPTETYSWTPKSAEARPAAAEDAEKKGADDKDAGSKGAGADVKPGESTGTDKASEPEPDAVMTDEGGPVLAEEETTAETSTVLSEDAPAATEATAHSYVGDNPPEGFVIKGNDRSKKYHVPGSGGYDRTIADVWFASEKDAEAAGFTKAQR